MVSAFGFHFGERDVMAQSWSYAARPREHKRFNNDHGGGRRTLTTNSMSIAGCMSVSFQG